MHRVQQLDGFGVSGHGCQLERITSCVVPMEQGSAIEKQLHHPCVSLLRGYMQRGHPRSITLVNYEGPLLGVQELAHCIVPSIAGCKVQRTLIVVVFQVDARPQPDEVLQRADMPIPTGVVQRGTAHAVLLVQEQLQLRLRLAVGHLLGEVCQPPAIHDDEVQHIARGGVLDTDARPKANQKVYFKKRKKKYY